MTWLPNYYKRILIECTYVFIGLDIDEYMGLIHLGSSSGTTNKNTQCVFTELNPTSTGSYVNRKKIAFTPISGDTSYGTLQCYAEIEYWNEITEEAYIWVRLGDIYSGDSTNVAIYLYYDYNTIDNFYIKDSTEITGNVWNGHHLQLHGLIKNYGPGLDYLVGRNEAPKLVNADTSNQVDGLIGYGVEFNGIDENAQRLTPPYILVQVFPFSMSVVIKTTNAVNDMQAFTISNNTGTVRIGLGVFGGVATLFTVYGGSTYYAYDVDSSSIADDNYHILTCVADSTTEIKLYVDGIYQESITDYFDVVADNPNKSYIGCEVTGGYSNYFEGIIDEIRVERTLPPQEEEEYVDYLNYFDNLFEYGNEEVKPQDDFYGLLLGKNYNDLNALIRGTSYNDMFGLVKGKITYNDTLFSILKSTMLLGDEVDSLTLGKIYNDLDGVILNKAYEDLYGIIKCEIPFISVYDFLEDDINTLEITSGLPYNEITLNFAYDYVSSKFRISLTKENPISKSIYGNNPEYKKSYDMYFIQETRVANKIADAILNTNSLPEIFCTFNHNLSSFYVEEDDPVTLSHLGGLGENGYDYAPGTVISRNRSGVIIGYKLSMRQEQIGLLRSQLVRLTIASGVGRASDVSISYAAGILTVTIYADIEGNPAINGAKVIIGGVTKITNTKGQAFFDLSPGTYTAYLEASGYENNKITFII